MNESEHDSGNDDPDREFVELMKRHQEAIQEGRMDEADALTQDLFAIAASKVNENPRPEWAFEEEARNYEAAGDWQAAEAAYRKALELADKADEAAWQCKAHSNLKWLLRLVGHRESALKHARLATELARRTEMSILLAMTLESEASFALDCSLLSEAFGAIQEAIQIVERDVPDDAVLYGRCLVVRAECLRQSGEFDRAGADLESALKKFKPLEAMEFAAGVHGGIAEWWTLKARLLTSLNQGSDILNAWSRAVASSRHTASLPQCAGPQLDNVLATRIWEYGKALSAAGCAEEAEQAFGESRGIRNRIGLPPFL